MSSVWLAGKKLVSVREEIHSIISLFCPPAYLMTTLELDKVWEVDYTLFDAEIASICTLESTVLSSISKDTLVNWSDKWIDILTDKLRSFVILFERYHRLRPSSIHSCQVAFSHWKARYKMYTASCHMCSSCTPCAEINPPNVSYHLRELRYNSRSD